MAMHLKLCFFVFLFLHCINLSTSSAPKIYPKPFFQTSLPSTFFALASTPAPAPAPNNNIPTTPSPLPAVPPPAQPPTWVPPPLPPPPTTDESSQGQGSSSGLSGGQKAGITIGTLAGAGLLVFGGMIYKKRRSNIARARFGSEARRPAL